MGHASDIPQDVIKVPICIDCDGTLIRTDLMHECVFMLLKTRPWKIPLLPVWLMRGKPALKERLAESATFDWSSVPLNAEVVQIAREARQQGRRVVLATAAHRLLAEGLAAHLGLFDEVIATGDGINMASHAKRDALVARFGDKGFDYIGDSDADIEVWRAARKAIVVTGSSSLEARARDVASVDRVIARPKPTLFNYLKVLRLHQWLKNLLIFVPAAAAHRILEWPTFTASVLAFIAFSLCASSVYVINDLLDLDADRKHPRKRNRGFASGQIPVSHGTVLAPLMLLLSVAVTFMLPLAFALVLAGYFCLTVSYSFFLKKKVIVDVMLLAALYTTRVIAGSAATHIMPSFWLLAFSTFIFLSLAVVKRYSEMQTTLRANNRKAAGRGYSVDDLPVLMSIGTGSGMVAVLVFSLYVNSPELSRIYPTPQWLWLIPPMLLYWVSRLWMKAHRDEVHDDPVVFAVRDWQSLAIVALSGIFFLLASH